MTDTAANLRRARALVEAAERAGHADAVADELDAVAAAITGDPAVARILLSPVVPPAQKVEAVTALGARAGLTPTVAGLLPLLAARHALGTLPGLARAYRARLLEGRNIVSASVTTAAPIEAARTDAIARRLAEVSGKQVQLAAHVDPALIGGVVARVGSIIYDGSITTQLARMRQALVENV
jgi:F-type H+-transporting ATPase subunit delta